MMRSGSSKGPVGKIAQDFFLRQVVPSLGATRREVTMGPRYGVDVGILRVTRDLALIITTDPLCLVPAFGWEGAARYAFHILANDLTTAGVPPQYLSVDWNLPPSMPEAALRTVLRTLGEECRRFGTAIVAGHTGRYRGASYPMVGGATLLATARRGRYVTSADAAPGSHLLLTRSAALESAVTVAHLYRRATETLLGVYTARGLRRRLPELSSAPEALEASRKVGLGPQAVSAMHDVAEGGVVGALVEMAGASHLDIEVDLSAVPVDPEVAELCSSFRVDPLTAMGQGSLLLAVHPSRVEDVVRVLEGHRLPVTDLGRFGRSSRRSPRVRDRGRSRRPPPVDGLTLLTSALEKREGRGRARSSGP